jgi:1-acyl-sn-glycerol-3-phosphate acyltransferase
MAAGQQKQGRTLGGPQAKGWHYTWRRRLFRWGIWQVLYRLWIRLHVDGWENLPAGGPVIIMGNHMASLDPLVMISFYPDRDIVPMAKLQAFSLPIHRYFLGHWGAIPVDRGEADTRAIRAALETLRQGKILMLYAEGTRSRTGLIRGEPGSVYLAAKTGATVVPAAIWGTRAFPRSWFKDFQGTPVYFRFGQPFRFRAQGGRPPREHIQAMTDEAMYRISALLPPEWRGVYSDLTQATTEHLDFDIAWEPVRRKLPRRVCWSP